MSIYSSTVKTNASNVNIRMKIYYAHHKWKYGTPIEDCEMKCLEKRFENAEIVNPKSLIMQNQTEDMILNDSYRIIDECDILVFSTCSGIIDHDVFNEIIYALNHKKKVYQLYGTECIEILDHDLFVRDVFREFIFRGDNSMYAIVNSPF